MTAIPFHIEKSENESADAKRKASSSDSSTCSSSQSSKPSPPPIEPSKPDSIASTTIQAITQAVSRNTPGCVTIKDAIAMTNTTTTAKADDANATNNKKEVITKEETGATTSKKKKVGSKKLLQPPRKPLSAYNFFFQDERAKLLGSQGMNDDHNKNEQNDSNKERQKRRPHRRSHGKIGFTELAKHVGQQWKTLDEESRKVYHKKFLQDKQRYAKELEQYEDRLSQMIHMAQVQKALKTLQQAHQGEEEEHAIKQDASLKAQGDKGLLQDADQEEEDKSALDAASAADGLPAARKRKQERDGTASTHDKDTPTSFESILSNAIQMANGSTMIEGTRTIKRSKSCSSGGAFFITKEEEEEQRSLRCCFGAGRSDLNISVPVCGRTEDQDQDEEDDSDIEESCVSKKMTLEEKLAIQMKRLEEVCCSNTTTSAESETTPSDNRFPPQQDHHQSFYHHSQGMMMQQQPHSLYGMFASALHQQHSSSMMTMPRPYQGMNDFSLNVFSPLSQMNAMNHYKLMNGHTKSARSCLLFGATSTTTHNMTEYTAANKSNESSSKKDDSYTSNGSNSMYNGSRLVIDEDYITRYHEKIMSDWKSMKENENMQAKDDISSCKKKVPKTKKNKKIPMINKTVVVKKIKTKMDENSSTTHEEDDSSTSDDILLERIAKQQEELEKLRAQLMRSNKKQTTSQTKSSRNIRLQKETSCSSVISTCSNTRNTAAAATNVVKPEHSPVRQTKVELMSSECEEIKGFPLFSYNEKKSLPMLNLEQEQNKTLQDMEVDVEDGFEQMLRAVTDVVSDDDDDENDEVTEAYENSFKNTNYKSLSNNNKDSKNGEEDVFDFFDINMVENDENDGDEEEEKLSPLRFTRPQGHISFSCHKSKQADIDVLAPKLLEPSVVSSSTDADASADEHLDFLREYIYD